MNSENHMQNRALEGKIAIITGGAIGIGRSIAVKLASDGAALALVDVNAEAARATADELAAAHGVRTAAYKADVSCWAEVEAFVDAVIAEFGRVDILVNNAGITRDNLLMRMTEQEWDAVIDINLKGSFNCMKAVCRPMMKQRSGRIINIASVVGQMGNAGQANYSASKGGLIAMTKTVARELASRGILVNAVAPGFIRTRMTDALTEDQKKKLSELIPLTRLGEPEDVANAVWFLCRDESSYITGQVIAVNGGMYL
jgi:3-oxoacyl-[acyl-carrier protein] reductase